MREIRYRAKNIFDKWVYGTNRKSSEKDYDLDRFEYYLKEEAFKAETRGMYTGVESKSGIPIYEGDILLNRQGNLGTVRYEYGALVLIDTCGPFNKDTGKDFRIMGNIHDNPTMIKEIK